MDNTIQNRSAIPSRLELVWDSGSTRSIVNLPQILQHTSPISGKIATGTGELISPTAEGELPIGPSLTLPSTWLIPDFRRNLLSLGNLCDQGLTVTLTSTKALAIDSSGRVRARADRRPGGLYIQSLPETLDECHILAPNSRLYYHCLFGHPSDRALARILQRLGLKPTDSSSPMPPCEACAYGKLRERPFKPTDSFCDVVGGRWHLDTAGPITPSIDGFRYFVLILDEASRKIMAALTLRTKGEIGPLLRQEVTRHQRERKLHLFAIRMDGAREFNTLDLRDLYSDYGIRREPVIPHMHARLAERVIQTVKNIARCILRQANLGISLWSFAIRHASKLYNSRPHSSLNYLSPDEAFGDSKASEPSPPSYIFGSCAVYAEPNKLKTKGLRPTGHACIYLGSNPTGPLVLNTTTKAHGNLGRTVTVFNGKFLSPAEANDLGIGWGEQVFQAVQPAANYEPPADPEPALAHPTETSRPRRKRPRISYEETPEAMDQCFYVSDLLCKSPTDSSAWSIRRRITDILETVPILNSPEDLVALRDASEASEVLDTSLALRRRFTNRPRFHLPPSHECLTMMNPKNLLPPSQPSILTEAPKSYAQAVKYSCWRDAIDKELDSIRSNRVFRLVDLPPGRVPLRSTWVFKVKRDHRGRIERYKARLCIKGFRQVQGVDFNLTFAPVGSRAALRLFLSYAVQKELTIHHWDVKTAFLNGELEEDIYMRQPAGLNDGSPKVWKLVKGLYGLKQAPRIWFQKIRSVLLELGLQQSSAEPCIFFNRHILLYLYVDDLLLASSTRSAYQSLKRALFAKFDMKDLGFPKKFLGFEVLQLPQGIGITGENYIKTVLEDFNLIDANPSIIPMTPGFDSRPSEDHKADPSECRRYQTLMGSLLYLATNLRPDIAYATSLLSQHMSNPEPKHWKAAKKVLRYLKGTLTTGIELLKYKGNRLDVLSNARGGRSSRDRICSICNGRHDQEALKCFTDSDYAANWARRSRTGYVCRHGPNLIAWRSRLQPVVPLSTCEAELYAMVDGSKEAEQLRKVLAELSMRKPFEDHHKCSRWSLHSDNQAAIAAVKEVGSRAKVTKHIDVRHRWLNDKVSEDKLVVRYVPTDKNVADLLTKALPQVTFEKLVGKLGLMKVSSQVRGSVSTDLSDEVYLVAE